MLVLFETAAGYAIFKLLDENKLTQTENLYHDFETPESASRVVKLKHFEKFHDTTEALSATTACVEGKISKSLRKIIKKAQESSDATEKLLVADAKLGTAIKDRFQLSCVSNTNVQELMRCIRSQMDSLLVGLQRKDLSAMALGLAHSLSRYKLKFSPDKVDTMVVQAVGLLDDLDKEINNYMMRAKEWYGWHFPELSKIVTDNLTYVKIILIMGTRDNALNVDLSDILTEDVSDKVKEAAEVSMGTEIAEEDIINIQHLCEEIVGLVTYRGQLYEYLIARMLAIAPNLSILVGELVGARLISHAGSLMNLAKHPASTLQILGAEKALFRALKTKRDTPKYGLIYHSQLVGQSSMMFKGKISRMLAAKAALATRIDALGEDGASLDLAAGLRVKIENRLKFLEEGQRRRISGTGKSQARFEKYHSRSEVRQYPVAADSTISAKRKADDMSNGEPETGKKKKKQKSASGQALIEEVEEEEQEEVDETDVVPKKKKKRLEGTLPAIPEEAPKKKKSAQKESGMFQDEEPEASTSVQIEEDSTTHEKKKKKKKKKKQQEMATE